MSSASVPKGELTAYERWEPSSFDGGRARTKAIRFPTAEQVEGIHQAAHDEGLAAGYAEGKQRVAAEAERLRALVEATAREVEACETAAAEGVIELALQVARQVIREAVRLRPELVLPAVREAVHEMPLFNQGLRLVLHPEDARLVRRHLGESLEHNGWKIVEDGQIERGGCRVRGNATEIDATLPTRWQRAAALLGADCAWLEAGDETASRATAGEPPVEGR